VIAPLGFALFYPTYNFIAKVFASIFPLLSSIFFSPLMIRRMPGFHGKESAPADCGHLALVG
jgi:hypothetical protein